MLNTPLKNYLHRKTEYEMTGKDTPFKNQLKEAGTDMSISDKVDLRQQALLDIKTFRNN